MLRFIFTLSVLLGLANVGFAQEKPAEPKATEPKPADNKPVAVPDKEKLYKEFEKTLTGATMIGQFTIIGKEGGLKKEEYGITSVTKLPDGDYWLFKARIKYGDKDVTLPLPIEVKWAGDTPVITLTDFTIPGMGTFSSRVVIYHNAYAGWWQHGEVGGHLFGTIVKKEEKDKDK